MTRPELVEVRRRTAQTQKKEGDDAESLPGSGLELAWKDGSRGFLSSSLLRKNCPCATCQDARGSTSHQKPLSPGRSLLRVVDASAGESENLIRVWPVGNYALGIAWGDKHDSGIFTYDLLFSLVREALGETR